VRSVVVEHEVQVQVRRQTITDYIAANNRDPKPFIWTASVDLILGKVVHLCGELTL